MKLDMKLEWIPETNISEHDGPCLQDLKNIQKLKQCRAEGMPWVNGIDSPYGHIVRDPSLGTQQDWEKTLLMWQLASVKLKLHTGVERDRCVQYWKNRNSVIKDTDECYTAWIV